MRILRDVHRQTNTGRYQHQFGVDVVFAVSNALDCFVHKDASEDPNDKDGYKSADYLCHGKRKGGGGGNKDREHMPIYAST